MHNPRGANSFRTHQNVVPLLDQMHRHNQHIVTDKQTQMMLISALHHCTLKYLMLISAYIAWEFSPLSQNYGFTPHFGHKCRCGCAPGWAHLQTWNECGFYKRGDCRLKTVILPFCKLLFRLWNISSTLLPNSVGAPRTGWGVSSFVSNLQRVNLGFH